MNIISFAATAIRRAGGHQMPRLGSWALGAFTALAPRHLDCEMFPGIHATLDLHDETQRSAFWLGTRFESPTGAILRRWTEPIDTVFFDIGSNFGLFSFLLLSANPQLEVYSFEPHPRTYETLRTISARNGLESHHHPVNLALGADTARLNLHPGTTDSGHSTLGEHPGLLDQSLIEVLVRPLPEWLAEQSIPWPDKPSWVAKIDVEGFELQVLMGLRPLLEHRCLRGLCVEINHFTLGLCQTSPDEVRSFLREVGYAPASHLPESRHPNFANCGNEFFVPA